MVIRKSGKSKEKIEREMAIERKYRINQKWDDYLRNISKENLNTEELVKFMSELNAIDYMILDIGGRDLLG